MRRVEGKGYPLPGLDVFKIMMKRRENYLCRVRNCSPNPDGIGYGPNKPNTINL